MILLTLTEGMTIMTDTYTKPVDDFLSSRDIHFSTQLIGDDCPRYCVDQSEPGIGTFPRKTHIHGQHWRITFGRGGRFILKGSISFVVDYWDSYNDAEYRWLRTHWRECISEKTLRSHGVNPDRRIQPKLRDKRLPTAYDVLSCVVKYYPGMFEDWCNDLGYGTDSRRAKSTYRACVDEYTRFAAFFTLDEIETLQEIAQ